MLFVTKDLYKKKKKKEFLKIGDLNDQVLADHTLGSGWLLLGRIT